MRRSQEIQEASTTDGLPVAPSLGPALAQNDLPSRSTLLARRDVLITELAVVLAIVAGVTAQALTALIGLITNLAFYGRLSPAFVSPADHGLGAAVVLVPVAGGLVVGVMARFGSAAIRGRGMPEAMEQVLTNRSRIPARMTLTTTAHSATPPTAWRPSASAVCRSSRARSRGP